MVAPEKKFRDRSESASEVCSVVLLMSGSVLVVSV